MRISRLFFLSLALLALLALSQAQPARAQAEGPLTENDVAFFIAAGDIIGANNAPSRDLKLDALGRDKGVTPERAQYVTTKILVGLTFLESDGVSDQMPPEISDFLPSDAEAALLRRHSEPLAKATAIMLDAYKDSGE
ncbi:MAG: hypothetical protein LBO66_15290 [Deltaproteobacteria bacterium]|jgi:hypothetical protein|nr:hypothetical protein [Deltaproteobacteria bacterium]